MDELREMDKAEAAREDARLAALLEHSRETMERQERFVTMEGKYKPSPNDVNVIYNVY